MIPIKTEKTNCTYAEDQQEYLPLPVQKINNEQGKVISCWQLSPEEIKTISQTGKLFISMWTFHQPLQPIRPFVIESE